MRSVGAVVALLFCALTIASGQQFFRPQLPSLYKYQANITATIADRSPKLRISLQEQCLGTRRLSAYMVDDGRKKVVLSSDNDTALVVDRNVCGSPKNYVLRSIFNEEVWGFSTPAIYEEVWTTLALNPQASRLRLRSLDRRGCLITALYTFNFQLVRTPIEAEIRIKWSAIRDSANVTYNEPVYMWIDVNSSDSALKLPRSIFTQYDFSVASKEEALNELPLRYFYTYPRSYSHRPKLPTTFTYRIETNSIYNVCKDTDAFYDAYSQLERFSCHDDGTKAIVDHRLKKVVLINEEKFCIMYDVRKKVFKYPLYSVYVYKSAISPMEHFGMGKRRMATIDSEREELKIFSSMKNNRTSIWYFALRLKPYENHFFFSEPRKVQIVSRRSISEITIKNFGPNHIPEGTFDIVECVNVQKHFFSFTFDIDEFYSLDENRNAFLTRLRKVLTSELNVSTTRIGDLAFKKRRNRITVEFRVAENLDAVERDSENIQQLVENLDLYKLYPNNLSASMNWLKIPEKFFSFHFDSFKSRLISIYDFFASMDWLKIPKKLFLSLFASLKFHLISLSDFLYPVFSHAAILCNIAVWTAEILVWTWYLFA